jgi:hypothetical protein
VSGQRNGPSVASGERVPALAGRLHHLTTTTAHDWRLVGHGVRGGQAMIATLRWRLLTVPAHLIRHARRLTLRLPPGDDLLAEILARLRALPEPSGTGRTAPQAGCEQRTHIQARFTAWCPEGR